MAVLISAMTGSGYLVSIHSSYATARSGAGSNLDGNLAANVNVGQTLSGGNYSVWEGFLSFDTSSIPPDATITAAWLDMGIVTDRSTQDFTVFARPYNAGYGPWHPVPTWIPGDQLGTQLSVDDAYLTTAGRPVGSYITFTDGGIAQGIKRGGITDLVLHSDRTQGGTAPTGDEFVEFANAGSALAPRLVIDYTGGTPIPPGPGELVIEFRQRTYEGPGLWRSIECQALGASWTRGSAEHRGLLNVPEAAQANVVLRDPDRLLDPHNPSSPWVNQIDVGSDIRFRLADRQVFGGRITTLEHSLEPGMGAPEIICTIEALEQQRKLAEVNVIAAMYPAVDWAQDNTSARVHRILDISDIPSGPGQRDVENGGQLLDSYVPGDDANSWDELVRAIQGELGSIELTAAGTVRTRLRASVWEGYRAPDLYLGGGGIPIDKAEYQVLQDTIRNQVMASPDQVSSLAPIEDVVSQALYGLRSYVDTKSPIAEAGVAAWNSYFLGRMKSPLWSWRVTVRPRTRDEVLAIEQVPLYYGRAQVNIACAGGADLDEYLRVVGLEWSVDPDTAVCTLVLGGP